ncbi:hypothetical protein F900_03067 [Acinetobacter modestus]|uniref:N-acetyltransferase domain-containing protein n=1 Tax=Acinetobacter modestus TaxID=1776740 RepID=N9NA74_9GAMM|nr:GNAT family N-acetyltransferase [Acinetobacter modestus]ENW98974.1 hypothetical protein F900_03067 [Acinetobacter modestus]
MQFKIIAAQDLNEQARQQIAELCFTAFDEDPWSQYAFMQTAVHMVGILDDKIVSHALWTDRIFTLNDCICIKTAYVEYVTTNEIMRGKGLASQLLNYLINALTVFGYELAALQPENDAFYKKLGWTLWLGNLYINENTEMYLTDEHEIMLYPLSLKLQDLLLDCKDGDVICADWREGELW